MKSMLGVVVIGRNEGERLRICLESLLPYTDKIVYVDSGSTDNSIQLANDFKVNVVNLDVKIPFTAARARNEGFLRLYELYPEVRYVQFVDGDCEVVEGWFKQAFEYLEQCPGTAVVCGRRRERYPSASLYNMLCDIEWDTPIGEAKACGGDAMIKADVFRDVSGYNPEVIAGEEPELCVRVRQNGWKVWRIDAEMTLHDANMTRFSQWWKRSVRGGYAYALGADMHGEEPEKHWIKEINRIRIWGIYIPAFLLLFGFVNHVIFYGFIIYLLQVARLAYKYSNSIDKNWCYAFFLTIIKFPEAQGQIKYLWDKVTNKKSKIIEYK